MCNFKFHHCHKKHSTITSRGTMDTPTSHCQVTVRCRGGRARESEARTQACPPQRVWGSGLRVSPKPRQTVMPTCQAGEGHTQSQLGPRGQKRGRVGAGRSPEEGAHSGGVGRIPPGVAQRPGSGGSTRSHEGPCAHRSAQSWGLHPGPRDGES